LDQGAAYLYQLYDAYAPDGPSLNPISERRCGLTKVVLRGQIEIVVCILTMDIGLSVGKPN
jgi:hypothetical protein